VNKKLLAAVVVGLAVLPGPAGAGTAVHTLAAEDEENMVTWEVLPKQNDDEPFRSNYSWLMKGGEKREDVVRVRNYSTRDMKLGLYASDAFNSENGAIDLLATGEKPKDIGNWIKLPMSTLTLKGGDFADIPFAVEVPKGAESGDHVGGIVTSYLGEGNAAGDGSRVTLDRRLGTRVQIRVDGPLNPSLAVTKLKTAYDGPTNPVGGGKLHATWTVKNEGNVRMAATQAIKAKGAIGFPSKSKKLADLPELLPGNTLTLSADLTGVYPAVRTSTEVTLTPKATREGDTFGPEVKPASAKAADWTFPWATLLLLLFLGGGFTGRQVLRKREQAKEDQRIEEKISAKLGGSVNREATS
jgi:hypothetical protein